MGNQCIDCCDSHYARLSFNMICQALRPTDIYMSAIIGSVISGLLFYFFDIKQERTVLSTATNTTPPTVLPTNTTAKNSK